MTLAAWMALLLSAAILLAGMVIMIAVIRRERHPNKPNIEIEAHLRALRDGQDTALRQGEQVISLLRNIPKSHGASATAVAGVGESASAEKRSVQGQPEQRSAALQDSRPASHPVSATDTPGLPPQPHTAPGPRRAKTMMGLGNAAEAAGVTQSARKAA